MSKFHQVIRDLQNVMKTSPAISPHLSWRLHPDDMLIVMNEARVHAEEREHPWMPLGEFYLMGVRIFADEQAPRLEEKL